jgi:hypothetical protein
VLNAGTDMLLSVMKWSKRRLDDEMKAIRRKGDESVIGQIAVDEGEGRNACEITKITIQRPDMDNWWNLMHKATPYQVEGQ